MPAASGAVGHEFAAPRPRYVGCARGRSVTVASLAHMVGHWLAVVRYNGVQAACNEDPAGEVLPKDCLVAMGVAPSTVLTCSAVAVPRCHAVAQMLAAAGVDGYADGAPQRSAAVSRSQASIFPSDWLACTQTMWWGGGPRCIAVD